VVGAAVSDLVILDVRVSVAVLLGVLLNVLDADFVCLKKKEYH
jgi:hypothetical protein